MSGLSEWSAVVGPTMDAEAWRVAAVVAGGIAWEPACRGWLEWVQDTNPPRREQAFPPWGLHLAQALLAWRDSVATARKGKVLDS